MSVIKVWTGPDRANNLMMKLWTQDGVVTVYAW